MDVNKTFLERTNMSLGVTTYDPTTKNAVNFTPAAVAHVRKEIAKHKAEGLRLGVKKAGCSGLKYIVDYVYDVKQEDHQFLIESDLKVFVDQQSLEALTGLTVDFIREGLNGRLKFINPNEKGSCGCGESFMV